MSEEVEKGICSNCNKAIELTKLHLHERYCIKNNINIENAISIKFGVDFSAGDMSTQNFRINYLC